MPAAAGTPTTSSAPVDDVAFAPSAMCLPADGRADSTGWCAELLTDASCQHRIVRNIHGQRLPCTWLDGGCRASSTPICDDEVAAGSGSSGMSAFTSALFLLCLALVAVAAVPRWRLIATATLRRLDGLIHLMRDGLTSTE